MEVEPSPALERVLRIPRYDPGPPVAEQVRELGLERMVQLASNENPWGPAPAVTARLARELADPAALGRYPASDGFYLRRAIAARRGLDPSWVILGAGSSELLTLAATAFLLDGGSTIAPRHSFALYDLVTRWAGGRFVEAAASAEAMSVDAILAAVQADTRVVFLANPNNPTGAVLERADLARLVRGLRPDILLVVDQAYAEYEDPETYPDAAGFLAERERLLVLHTFSKIHGLAGLRVGYGVARPEVLDLLDRVRLPFNTNHLAQVAAEAALAETDFQALSRARAREARAAFRAEAAAHPCRLYGQGGNFVLLETRFPAPGLFRDLRRRGILVLPMQGYGLPNHVRITLGTPEEMATFWNVAGPLLDASSCGCP